MAQIEYSKGCSHRNRPTGGSQSISKCMREIGWAVSRFLFPAPREIRKFGGRRVQTSRLTSLFWRTRFWPPMIAPACERGMLGQPSIRIFAYVIMMFLARHAARPQTRESALAPSTIVCWFRVPGGPRSRRGGAGTSFGGRGANPLSTVAARR